MHDDVITALAAGGGVLSRAAHPWLGTRLDRALRTGELTAVLPGVYVRSDAERTLELRARIACAADADAVVCGAAAAHLIGWTHVPRPRAIAVATHLRTPRDGFLWLDRKIPSGARRTLEDGVRVTTKALTALDLAEEFGHDELERALRAGVRHHALQRALDLTPGRRGRHALRRAVATLASEPWSPAESAAHARLKRAAVQGWEANRSIYDRRGEVLLAKGDLVFAAHRLVIEIDGKHHHSPGQLARDYERDLALARAGWEVVRVTAAWVLEQPDEFADAVRQILATREARPPDAGRPKRPPRGPRR